MRRTSARMFLVTSALIASLVVFRPADAAHVSDNEFKALLDQDIKIIAQAVEAVEKAAPKDKKVVERNASSGIKSSALIIAGYANDRIDGKNADADGKAATIRDAALKIYKAGADKDFKAVSEGLKGLKSPTAAAGAKKIDLAMAVKSLGDVTQKEVMHNFLKTTQYGTNVEADIIANSRKATAKPADVALMAQRVLIMGDYNKIIVKAENAEDKKIWNEYNDKMIKATQALLETTKKKTSAADLAKAFTAVDSTCKLCHDDFK